MDREGLIVTLCREAGDVAADEDILEGWEGNHCGCCGEEMTAAAAGDVVGLIHVRLCMGLPVLT